MAELFGAKVVLAALVHRQLSLLTAVVHHPNLAPKILRPPPLAAGRDARLVRRVCRLFVGAGEGTEGELRLGCFG
jgi:hypothetical protein